MFKIIYLKYVILKVTLYTGKHIIITLQIFTYCQAQKSDLLLLQLHQSERPYNKQTTAGIKQCYTTIINIFTSNREIPRGLFNCVLQKSHPLYLTMKTQSWNWMISRMNSTYNTNNQSTLAFLPKWGLSQTVPFKQSY